MHIVPNRSRNKRNKQDFMRLLYRARFLHSPKSKEGCFVTLRQGKWLSRLVMYTANQRGHLKTYCMVKRLILFCTNEYPNDPKNDN